MIYLVTGNKELFKSDIYKIISVKESLLLLKDFKMIQFDTETSGRDAHICNLLCMQFGNSDKSIQIVVDCTTISPLLYKEILETKYIIGQNLKFDLQFLYKYKIVPTKVYDTMIVEQVLYLGFPYVSISPYEYYKYNYDFPYNIVKDSHDEDSYMLSYSLKALVLKYFNVHMDKTVRGEIIWRGLDTEVIKYAATDVIYLYDIMMYQLQECKKKECIKAAELECNFVPAIAYLEWSGIKLDAAKWRDKMENYDQVNYNNSVKALNEYAISNPKLKSFIYIDYQGDLFNGFDTTPKVNINWSSPTQVVKIAKILGFNTTVSDKKTGEDKDSVIEKQLKGQKGIDDKFLKLYFDHQEYHKVCTSFGQNHLNAINPITGRIHTTFKQLGCSSGRMSCGSNQVNTDLAKLKHLPIKPSNDQKKKGLLCSYPK